MPWEWELLVVAAGGVPIQAHAADLPGAPADLGVPLGPVLPWTGASRDALKGRIVLAPPAATTDRWSRRLPDPVVAIASGWMRVRQRAKARGVELPLVISDHADWDELTATIDEVAAEEVWVTHGREEALVHFATKKGYHARALALAGFHSALPIGILTGTLAFIPYVGYSIGLVLALGAALLQFDGWYGPTMVALVYGLGQGLEGFVLTPRLVGERIGLHPLAVIFALLAFGQLFGFFGVLVALPSSAVLLVALRRLKKAYFESAFYGRPQ